MAEEDSVGFNMELLGINIGDEHLVGCTLRAELNDPSRLAYGKKTHLMIAVDHSGSMGDPIRMAVSDERYPPPPFSTLRLRRANAMSMLSIEPPTSVFGRTSSVATTQINESDGSVLDTSQVSATVSHPEYGFGGTPSTVIAQINEAGGIVLGTSQASATVSHPDGSMPPPMPPQVSATVSHPDVVDTALNVPMPPLISRSVEKSSLATVQEGLQEILQSLALLSVPANDPNKIDAWHITVHIVIFDDKLEDLGTINLSYDTTSEGARVPSEEVRMMIERINSIHSGNSTNIIDAWNLLNEKEKAVLTGDASASVLKIVLTDGYHNSGKYVALKSAYEYLRTNTDSRRTTFAIGVGNHLNYDSMFLQELAGSPERVVHGATGDEIKDVLYGVLFGETAVVATNAQVTLPPLVSLQSLTPVTVVDGRMVLSFDRFTVSSTILACWTVVPGEDGTIPPQRVVLTGTSTDGQDLLKEWNQQVSFVTTTDPLPHLEFLETHREYTMITQQLFHPTSAPLPSELRPVLSGLVERLDASLPRVPEGSTLRYLWNSLRSTISSHLIAINSIGDHEMGFNVYRQTSIMVTQRSSNVTSGQVPALARAVSSDTHQILSAPARIQRHSAYSDPFEHSVSFPPVIPGTGTDVATQDNDASVSVGIEDVNDLDDELDDYPTNEYDDESDDDRGPVATPNSQSVLST